MYKFSGLIFLLFVALVSAPSLNASEFDRKHFGGWADENKDCLDTRQVLLIAFSLKFVELSKNGCRTIHGQWLDPYSGQIFTDAIDLDIDHLVPLKWA